MKSRLLILACFVGCLFAPAATAAPVPNDPKNASVPTLSLQVKSLDHSIENLRSTMKASLPDGAFKEFEKGLQTVLDPALIKGLDTKRPFGMYASIDAGLLKGEFTKSSIVLLIPVTDEKDFLAMLEKIELKVTKNGEFYTIPIPDFPVGATLRFMKGYAYIGVAGENLDPKLLLDPKEVMNEKETAGVVLRIRVDRIPDEMKQAAVLFLGEAIEKAPMNAEEEFKPIVADIMKNLMRWTKMGLDEGKDLTLRLDLDPRTRVFSLEKVFEAKSGSPLSKAIASIKPTKNDFANLIQEDSAALGLFQLPLFVEEIQSTLVKLIDVGAKAAAKDLKADSPKEAKEMFDQFFKMLDRSVKSGNVDLAATLRGPDKNGQFTAVGVIGLNDTPSLDKAVKEALKASMKAPKDKIKIDAFKVNDVNVHEFIIGDELQPEALKIFGKSSVFVAMAPSGVFVTFGAQATEVMKEVLAIKMTPKPAPLFQLEISGKRMMSLLKISGAPIDGPGGNFLDKWAMLDRINVFTLKVEGGEKLVTRFEMGLLPFVGSYWLGRTAAQEFKEVKPAVKVDIKK